METAIHKIELQVEELEDASGLFELSDNNENIDLITEKNFTGDLTTIELYISLTVNVIVLIMPLIKTLIKRNKVSSIKIDGEKIEVTNVSQKIIEDILKYKMEQDTGKVKAKSGKSHGKK